MSFFDVVYKILAEGYSPSEYGGKGIAVAMIASAVLSVYIFFCYREAIALIKIYPDNNSIGENRLNEIYVFICKLWNWKANDSFLTAFLESNLCSAND